MSQSECLTGIILEVKNFREDDKMVSFYSQRLGKIKVLVRSGRKITSKLAPIISERFSLLVLTLTPGRNFYHLIGGKIKKHFKNILTDYIKITRTARILAKINELIKPRRPDRKIFDLMVKYLQMIDLVPSIKVPIINYAFLIKLLALLGYRPEVRRCLLCHQKPILEPFDFDLEKGGIVCRACQQESFFQTKITFETRKILENLLYKDFDFLAEQAFGKKDFLLAQEIIKKFFHWHLI